jgi:hypothetical protein
MKSYIPQVHTTNDYHWAVVMNMGFDARLLGWIHGLISKAFVRTGEVSSPQKKKIKRFEPAFGEGQTELTDDQSSSSSV